MLSAIVVIWDFELRNIAAFNFVYSLASTNINQSEPNMVTMYMSIRSQMSLIMGQAIPDQSVLSALEIEKLYVKSSPSYIQDTNDFINKLKDFKDRILEDSILFCFGVFKLYPSVPMKEGLAACKEALETRIIKLIDTEKAMKLIEAILDNNIFEFGDNYFIQRKGVAIGSRLGKNFACSTLLQEIH